MDTPGLVDIKMRQASASAITDALRRNGNDQIFFVVTLNAGKPRLEDLATIWLVLLNAPEITFFSIILNKLLKKEHDCLQDDMEKSRLLAPLRFFSVPIKYSVLLLLHNQMLEDDDNEIVNFPVLVHFVKDAPCVVVHSLNISDIPSDDDSFKENLDLAKRKLDRSTDYLLPVMVRH